MQFAVVFSRYHISPCAAPDPLRTSSFFTSVFVLHVGLLPSNPSFFFFFFLSFSQTFNVLLHRLQQQNVFHILSSHHYRSRQSLEPRGGCKSGPCNRSPSRLPTHRRLVGSSQAYVADCSVSSSSEEFQCLIDLSFVYCAGMLYSQQLPASLRTSRSRK